MALIDPVPGTKTQFSAALPADTIFTCRRGAVGITTDDGSGQDYFILFENSSKPLILSAGLQVHYVDFDKNVGSILHTMPG